MRSAREDRSTGTRKAQQSSHVKYGPRGERTVPTRRQLLASGLTIAVVMSSVSPLHANSVVVNNVRVVVSNTIDYRSGLARLASRYKAALVDIGAEWCDFCKTIDQRILPHPDVQRALTHVALVRVDVTQMTQTAQDLLRYLRADGPPTVFVVDTKNGREFPGTRSVGSFTAADLLRRLGPFVPT